MPARPRCAGGCTPIPLSSAFRPASPRGFFCDHHPWRSPFGPSLPRCQKSLQAIFACTCAFIHEREDQMGGRPWPHSSATFGRPLARLRAQAYARAALATFPSAPRAASPAPQPENRKAVRRSPMSSASLAVAARPHPEAARVAALSAAIALNLAALLILTRPLAPQAVALVHKLVTVPQVTF